MGYSSARARTTRFPPSGLTFETAPLEDRVLDAGGRDALAFALIRKRALCSVTFAALRVRHPKVRQGTLEAMEDLGWLESKPVSSNTTNGDKMAYTITPAGMAKADKLRKAKS